MTLSHEFADTNCCLPLALGLVIFSEEVTFPIPCGGCLKCLFPQLKTITLTLQNSPAFPLLPEENFKKANPITPDFRCHSIGV